MKKFKFTVPLIILAVVFLSLGIGFMLFSHGGSNNGSYEPAPFKNIDVSVISADVNILKGDKFFVEYRLHGKEQIEKLSVEGDTLVLDTELKLFAPHDFDDRQVNIYLPDLSTLGDIKIKSTAGDIKGEGLTFKSAELKSTSGDIEIKNSTGESITCETVSDDIELEGSINSVSAKSVSGDIEVYTEGTAYNLETVSGDIDAQGRFEGISAESIGGVTHNGAKQGSKLNLGTENISKFKSVSGKITVTDK